MIDLFDLTPSCDLQVLTKRIASTEPLITQEVFPQVTEILEKLQKKLKEPVKTKFYLFKTLQTHILPLTNVSFDKSGKKCITGSYDRTCRIWNVESGDEEKVLKGHENVVFAVAYNYPRWCDNIVGAEFNPSQSELLATCSMDNTARVFHSETGQEVNLFADHTAEVISARFNKDGNLLLTASFDETATVWDMRTKEHAIVIRGHEAELSNAVWNFQCSLIATSSLDRTAKIWDLRRLDEAQATASHKDEVLDVAFNCTGTRLATGSADCTAKVWDVTSNFELVTIMAGHADEVSKVTFSPPGGLLLTASADKSARIWNSATGACTQTLSGHDGEVFSCSFNYSGDAIITASKDNTCKIWR
ncbi:wd-repeat protein [Anopheles sinensis]|uniref:WD_REPEATS_REGION domain-containing protein n=1 Tax=Anopheles sinensis TaxID=74873 RepID=A0A084W3S3_ANOSI|nr:wd-repeat protein [Anopheles sinensis]